MCVLHFIFSASVCAISSPVFNASLSTVLTAASHASKEFVPAWLRQVISSLLSAALCRSFRAALLAASHLRIMITMLHLCLDGVGGQQQSRLEAASDAGRGGGFKRVAGECIGRRRVVPHQRRLLRAHPSSGRERMQGGLVVVEGRVQFVMASSRLVAACTCAPVPHNNTTG